jgi:hypothetical protein
MGCRKIELTTDSLEYVALQFLLDRFQASQAHTANACVLYHGTLSICRIHNADHSYTNPGHRKPFRKRAGFHIS